MHNTVLLDIWWNMLVKFSKEIGNSLAKIIDTKVNSRPSTSEMELFPQVITGSSVKWSDPGHFLKAQLVIFRDQKYVKKGTWK